MHWEVWSPGPWSTLCFDALWLAMQLAFALQLNAGFDSVFAAPSGLNGWSGWVGSLQEGATTTEASYVHERKFRGA